MNALGRKEKEIDKLARERKFSTGTKHSFPRKENRKREAD